MSARVWTFVRCGINGKPDGVYDERYERAADGSLAALGDRAEFIHDEDMPEPLRYRGSWGMLSLYNPNIDAGNDDGVIYAAGLDTVFLRDINKLMDALDEVDEDVVGTPCFGDGGFNSMVLRIRKGSPGARAIWDKALACDFKPDQRCEHYFVRQAQEEPSLGTMRNGLVESYKGHCGKFPRRAVPKPNIDTVSALVFHGRPRPHHVCLDPKLKLHDLVMEYWGQYAGY